VGVDEVATAIAAATAGDDEDEIGEGEDVDEDPVVDIGTKRRRIDAIHANRSIPI
jgi:hypothetical protein